MNKEIFKSELLGERYEKISHPSGLDIYVFPKKLTTTYAIFGVKYGSIDNCFSLTEEAPSTYPDGIAHFLEHQLFVNEDGSDSFERFRNTVQMRMPILPLTRPLICSLAPKILRNLSVSLSTL